MIRPSLVPAVSEAVLLGFGLAAADSRLEAGGFR